MTPPRSPTHWLSAAVRCRRYFWAKLAATLLFASMTLVVINQQRSHVYTYNLDYYQLINNKQRSKMDGTKHLSQDKNGSEGSRSEPVRRRWPTCKIPKLDPFDPQIMRLIKPWPKLKCKRVWPDQVLSLQLGELRFNVTALEAEYGVPASDLGCKYRCIHKSSKDDVGSADYGSWVSFVGQNLTSNPIPVACDIAQTSCFKRSSLLSGTLFDAVHFQIVPTIVHRNLVASELVTDTQPGSKLATERAKHLAMFPNQTISATAALKLDSDTPPQAVDVSSSQTQPEVRKKLFSGDTNAVPPNVVMLIIDSMSHNHFVRMLPQTHHILRDEYKAVIFDGMVKVGLNSFPNVIPILTGAYPYGARDKHMLPNKHGPFDNWPLIWYNYTNAGYATLYVEDFIKFGLFQSYGDVGFINQPTTHYSRPLFVASKASKTFSSSAKFCLGNDPMHAVLTRSILSFFEAYSATQPKYAHVHVAEITHDDAGAAAAADADLAEFLRSFSRNGYAENTFFFLLGDHGLRFGALHETQAGQIEDRMPFFSLTPPRWFRQAHPDLMMTLAENGRHRLTSFYDVHATLRFILDRLWTETRPGGKWGNHECFQKTSVSKRRSTKSGRSKEVTVDRNLESLRNTSASNLAPAAGLSPVTIPLTANESNAPTPWSKSADREKQISSRERKAWSCTRHGVPLFMPLSASRTCAQASIPEAYCICEEVVAVPLNDSRAVQSAHAVVDAVNRIVGSSKYAHLCAALTLDQLRIATAILPNQRAIFDVKNTKVKGPVTEETEKRTGTTTDTPPAVKMSTHLADVTIVFKILVQVQPGAALFHATVQHSVAAGSYRVVGGVERANRYGNTSACVKSDHELVNYCYCK